MSKPATIIWFRRDLRLHDNPAWNAAVRSGAPILPLYIHSPQEEGKWQRGAASNWWLHHALADLSNQLQQRGHKLIICTAENAQQALDSILSETPTSTILWNRCYEPAAVKRDTAVKSQLTQRGIAVKTFNGNLLFDPLKISTKSGTPFKVFTPFWKHCSTLSINQPDTATKAGTPQDTALSSIPLDALALLPTIPWDSQFPHHWNPTRQGAHALLNTAAEKATNYATLRDQPSTDGTSRLSPYLHFGQISPAECYQHILDHSRNSDTALSGILRQLFWREFSAHLLFHFPHTHDSAFKADFNHFPWKLNTQLLALWQRGLTGYPIVDAGMRQLWETGWMHNRVRMIVASFLVKHLLQPWQEGAHWFWDTLLDADLPNNSMGWQWIAGSGADAAPYFRIFNPITQSQKFDPKGDYIKTWLPELKNIPAKQLHAPWEIPPLELAAYGVTLGKNYPRPIVEHATARQRALAAYHSLKA